MKEILFRGKENTGNWVYGSLILAGTYCCILESEEDVHAIDYPYLDDDLGTIDGKATPVIPETIGRLINYPCYDGACTDQRFFEGDIIEVYRSRRADVDHDKPDSIAIVVDEHTITENGRGLWFPQDTTQVKVIGNIHDNPELVGKKYADLYKYYHGFDSSRNLHAVDTRLKEPDKELYEGDDVICKEPWDPRIIEGHSGAFCECGHVLHIKTPRRKNWHSIKCPMCGHIVNLYCGEEGEQLSMDDVRTIVPSLGILGD